MHCIVGLFEVNEAIGQLMVVQLQVLLDIFGILHRVLAFVKNEAQIFLLWQQFCIPSLIVNP
jgi:hypothetical protein